MDNLFIKEDALVTKTLRPGGTVYENEKKLKCGKVKYDLYIVRYF